MLNIEMVWNYADRCNAEEQEILLSMTLEEIIETYENGGTDYKADVIRDFMSNL